MKFDKIDYRIKVKEFTPFFGLREYVDRVYPLKERATYNLELLDNLVSATRRVKALTLYNVVVVGGLIYATVKGLESMLS